MKLSPTQQEVVDTLIDLQRVNSASLIRYEGGFWSFPNNPHADRFGALGKPRAWHTTIQTIRALEKKGYLLRANKAEEWRDERLFNPDPRYIARTCGMPGRWSMARTVQGAVKLLRSRAGRRWMDTAGYEVYHCHNRTSVNDMGAFSWFPEEGGYNPVLIRSVPPKTAKAA